MKYILAIIFSLAFAPMSMAEDVPSAPYQAWVCSSESGMTASYKKAHETFIGEVTKKITLVGDDFTVRNPVVRQWQSPKDFGGSSVSEKRCWCEAIAVVSSSDIFIRKSVYDLLPKDQQKDVEADLASEMPLSFTEASAQCKAY
jgi:hypothetical protein